MFLRVMLLNVVGVKVSLSPNVGTAGNFARERGPVVFLFHVHRIIRLLVEWPIIMSLTNGEGIESRLAVKFAVFEVTYWCLPKQPFRRRLYWRNFVLIIPVDATEVLHKMIFSPEPVSALIVGALKTGVASGVLVGELLDMAFQGE